MPKKIKIPVDKINGEEVEPIEVTLDAELATQQAETGMAAARIQPEQADHCCPIKLPLDLAGAGMGMHLQAMFRAEGFWNAALGKYQYKLLFEPSQKYKNVMQTFINHLNAIYPCVKRVSSDWSLSEQSFGPGHTVRQKALRFWTGFDVGGGGNMIQISNPPGPGSMWKEYFETPTDHDNTPSVAHGAQFGLDFNTTYAIASGTWIDKGEGCVIPREQECLSGAVWTNFNFRTSPDQL